MADLHTSSDRPQFRTRNARRHEWHAVLATLETDPHDADALLAALRTPPLDHEFANVSPDALDGASALVNAARAALTAQFGEPHPLRDGSAVAFMGDSDEWVIAGALRVNPDWPSHGPWHQHSAPVALLRRPERVVLCGPAVTRVGPDVLAAGYVYTQLHNRDEVRVVLSLAHRRC